jgi:hypothetical protein
MNLLLRLLERRYVLSIAVALTAVWASGRWGGYALGQADLLRHPPAETASPLAADIKKEADARDSAALVRLHRAVSAEIKTAPGIDARKFQRLADNALRLDSPKYRSAAIERLNKLRLAIPRRQETFRPASDEDISPEPLNETRPRAKDVSR